MNKFEEKRSARKVQILAETKKLMLKRGISDRLMSEIATRAGISRQQLYAYYNNVDEIVADVMQGVLENSYLARIAEAPETDSPENIIRYSILTFRSLSEEVHDDLLFLSLYTVYAATHKLSAKHKGSGVLLFEKQILAGQENGIFRTDKPLGELTTAVSHILAAYTSYSETLSPEGREQMLSEELLNRLADMVLSYLRND